MSDPVPLTRPRRRPAERLAVRDVVPITPNAIAVFFSFVVLLVGLRSCLEILWRVRADIAELDRFTSVIVWGTWQDSLLIAAAGALGFLVIGVMLQVWRHRRPFGAGWPVLLGWLLFLLLILPESIADGASTLPGAVVATIFAFAFAIHWSIVAVMGENWG